MELGRHHHAATQRADACCGATSTTVSTRPAPAGLLLAREPDTELTTYHVAELDCATEERELRDVLEPLAGVHELTFDLVARQVTIAHALADPAPLAAAIRSAGMRPEPVAPPSSTATTARSLPRATLVTTALAGVLAVGSEVVVVAGQDEQSPLVAIMAGAAILLGGRDTLRKGGRALRARRLTMALLMTVAVIGAVAIGQWPEAAVVIWLFGLAELIEALSLERARDAIRSLVTLAPETARVRTDAGVEEWPAAHVPVGAVIVVRPGERVALDGVVAAGTTSIDQAPITGESVPVAKRPGDPVFAGTINERGTIDVRVTAARGDGTLDRIARSIQAAQAQRAPAQRFVDRFAAVYAPIVFAAAVLTATLPVLLGAGSFRDWLYRALVLLVLACPCALVISTPVTVVAGLGGAARRGILVKGGAHLEQARRIAVVAVDKTGTLTTGRPVVTDVHVVADGWRPDDVRRLAASIDASSEHPVASAIVAAWPGSRLPVADFEALPGRGVAATVDGVRYHLGNHRLVEEQQRCDDELELVLADFEDDAKTAVVLMTDDAVVAVIAVADTIRRESAAAVRDLRRAGIHVVMLSGDNGPTARAVARQAGIDEVHGDLLPDDKLRVVRALASRGRVAMVGDGINDAPALATATLGVAMGAAGSDTAIETADVALMDDDPRKIAELVRISRHTTHVLWQNITFAIAVKAVFFALTFTGMASLWVAVLADMGASLIVIANGLRLLRRPSCSEHPDTPGARGARLRPAA
jgi:Cd2+/Zn2+-exporting ATPase